MAMEDIDEMPDVIAYSQSKLSNLYSQMKGDKKKAVYKYLDEVNYDSIDEFLPDLEWFNVSEPLSFEEHLKGKLVVLDFFTYCCINCMHILPHLKELEHEFSVEDGLVVIGVHSAKFANEKLSSNILSAVQRYNISHPVVNDRNCEIWKSCDVHCWPTLLVISPEPSNKPLLMLMGEGNHEELQTFIYHSLQYYKEKKQLSNHKLPIKSAYHLLPPLKGPLLFPGKITLTLNPTNNEEIIAISDTGNNRILILNNKGEILHSIGALCGFKDGNFENAEFNNPQGVCFLNPQTLFVCDTENHAIRKIDLLNKNVVTVAGTGKQGNDYQGGKMGTFQEISSPWDVVIYEQKNVLLFASAGTHQIWALFLEDTIWWKSQKYLQGTCVSLVGSGREENKNNRYPHAAAFAQPSGLSINHESNELFVADSESSSVRKINLLDGSVSAVVGGDKNPQNLFAFGDKDGILHNAKLQHVLGVTMAKDGSLLVADSYNHKIKKVDIGKNEIKTLIYSPKNLNKDALDGLEINFNEPGGLCQGLNNKIYVADTNNHLIKIIEIEENSNIIKQITKLDIKLKSSSSSENKNIFKNYEKKTIKPLILNPKGGKLNITLKLKFEDGLKLNEGAPQKWFINFPNALYSAIPEQGSDVEEFNTILSIPPFSSSSSSNSLSTSSSEVKEEGEQNTNINFAFKIVTCTEKTCIPKNFVVSLPLQFNKEEKNVEFEQKVTILVGQTKLEIN